MGANPALRRRATPAQVLALGFAGLILMGTILLSLPFASSGERISLIDALFTATSAVCVTGLTVRDTSTFFSLPGQLIILFLIQVGGLGYMTMASLIALLLGRRITLRERLILREALQQMTMEGLIRFLKRILWITLAVEGFATLVLTLRFLPHQPWPRSLLLGLFHSISAFCNAGFSLFPHNLQGFVADPVVNLTIATNIVLGGIGYHCLADLFQHSHFPSGNRHLALHTKLALGVTALLLALGTASFFFLERSNPQTLGSLPLPTQIMASFFQAVTPRTAGFNTIPLGALTPPCLFFILLLMFIGASPGGTGGGIKTTTFATLVLSTWSTLRGRREVNLFHRQLPSESIHKAFVVCFLALALVLIASLLLLITEGQPFLSLLFEEVSAFGTVGLSVGAANSPCSLSSTFSPMGKGLIILTMFAGRLGPVTIGSAFLSQPIEPRFRYPEEGLLIG